MAGSARLSSRGDQTELVGILNTLYERHLPLLSVQYLGNEPSSPDVTNKIKSL